MAISLVRTVTKDFMRYFLKFTLSFDVKLASAIEILKLQETQKYYSGAYDQFLISTKTSGWTVCKEYAASLWIKKVSWASSWEAYFRLSNDPS